MCYLHEKSKIFLFQLSRAQLCIKSVFHLSHNNNVRIMALRIWNTMVFYPVSEKSSLKEATKKLEFLDKSTKETIFTWISDAGGQDNPTIFIPHLKLIKTTFFSLQRLSKILTSPNPFSLQSVITILLGENLMIVEMMRMSDTSL